MQLGLEPLQIAAQLSTLSGEVYYPAEWDDHFAAITQQHVRRAGSAVTGTNADRRSRQTADHSAVGEKKRFVRWRPDDDIERFIWSDRVIGPHLADRGHGFANEIEEA